mmetsp:Transcript_11112/g.41506  ORF Transcript_11112/g.41506 Transcript_11112/m.41506 type:complete len:411 (-) Transcript_11112:3462-4694(-)
MTPPRSSLLPPSRTQSLSKLISNFEESAKLHQESLSDNHDEEIDESMTRWSAAGGSIAFSNSNTTMSHHHSPHTTMEPQVESESHHDDFLQHEEMLRTVLGKDQTRMKSMTKRQTDASLEESDQPRTSPPPPPKGMPKKKRSSRRVDGEHGARGRNRNGEENMSNPASTKRDRKIKSSHELQGSTSTSRKRQTREGLGSAPRIKRGAQRTQNTMVDQLSVEKTISSLDHLIEEREYSQQISTFPRPGTPHHHRNEDNDAFGNADDQHSLHRNNGHSQSSSSPSTHSPEDSDEEVTIHHHDEHPSTGTDSELDNTRTPSPLPPSPNSVSASSLEEEQQEMMSLIRYMEQYIHSQSQQHRHVYKDLQTIQHERDYYFRKLRSVEEWSKNRHDAVGKNIGGIIEHVASNIFEG